jgi:hypothetical protein
MPNHRMFRRAIMTAAGALTVAAVVQQLRRPRSERTWQGQIIGVPYDFRKPTIARLREQWWNPDGVGWSVNGYRLVHRGRKPAAEVTDLEVKE